MPDPTWTVSEDGVLLASVSGCEAPYRFARNRSDLSDAEYDALAERIRKAEHHDQLAAELDRIRPLIGMHDPTGADHMEDAARLATENDDLRARLEAAEAVIRRMFEGSQLPVGAHWVVRFDGSIVRASDAEVEAIARARGETP